MFQSYASSTAKKHGFCFPARGYLAPFVSQKKLNLEHCSHISEAAPPTTFHLLMLFRRRQKNSSVIQPCLRKDFSLLAHRRPVGNLSLFSRYIHGFDHLYLIPPLTIPGRSISSSNMHTYNVQSQQQFLPLFYS